MAKVTAIICPECGDIVWSRYRHDCRYCSCGYCYIDGGRDYTRVGGKELERIKVIEREVDSE